MGKVVVSEFISLDGVVEDPGGAEGTAIGGWAFRFQRGEEGDRFKLEEVMQAGAMLLGRKTYQGFAAVWPGIEDEAGFAARMNGMPKYVVSQSLVATDWNNSTVVEGDLGPAVRKLAAASEGGLLVAGSITLVRALAAADLIDELRLMLYPVVLGQGLRLFGEGPARSFRLLESRPVGSDGVLALRYEAVRPGPS